MSPSFNTETLNMTLFSWRTLLASLTGAACLTVTPLALAQAALAWALWKKAPPQGA